MIRSKKVYRHRLVPAAFFLILNSLETPDNIGNIMPGFKTENRKKNRPGDAELPCTGFKPVPPPVANRNRRINKNHSYRQKVFISKDRSRRKTAEIFLKIEGGSLKK
jgi:hypothetical protein